MWLDPSVDRDGSPAWSADGTRVAFIRTPSVREQLPFMPRREGHPWSIRVADARTGEGREVWRAQPGPGSVFHGDDDRNVAFSETVDLVEELRAREVHVEQLVFPDEVHGFLLHRSWLAAYRASADFLARHLFEGLAAANGR